ncbi:carboxypeptidase-like regulatory domain-containing protein [Belliella sp. R4-6]|uniref:Carboxypeptidase-like regulatory domain-containing protein n=1 Tax=Belliella alkalica TaxID=1730871 RepID=A0ABS9VGW0_9BACT|nr:carboxypeptidase-like regulatory domain-containing protein [Belliella alkalica]MCH7415663.1 carboxypeptidase-like regulatory domain-containing protein [Belliella alkalica]
MDNRNVKILRKKPFDKIYDSFSLDEKARNQEVCKRLSKHQNNLFYDVVRTYRHSLTFIILAGFFLFVGSKKSIAKNQFTHTNSFIINQNYDNLEFQVLKNNNTESQIQGIVVDSHSKKTLQGVAILIQKSVVGTVTSKNGEFNLAVPDQFNKKKVKR